MGEIDYLIEEYEKHFDTNITVTPRKARAELVALRTFEKDARWLLDSLAALAPGDHVNGNAGIRVPAHLLRRARELISGDKKEESREKNHHGTR